MSQEEWRIGRFTFDSEEEYEQAVKDQALIRIIKRENKIEDPEVAKQVYDRLRFSKDVLGSKLGKAFFYELSAYIARGEKKEEKTTEGAFLETKPGEGFVWPSDLEAEQKRERKRKRTGVDEQSDDGADTQSADRKASKRAWLIFVVVISIIVLFICVFKLVSYELMTAKSTQDIEKLRAMIGESTISIEPSANSDTSGVKVLRGDGFGESENGVIKKYSELHEMNSDMVGWVSIEGTNIDYPVMQNFSDGEYYLHKGFDKKDSDEGLPFLDFRCTINPLSTNQLIYGHNMKNGHMFADLMKYEDEKFFNEHRLIRYDMMDEEGYYDIVAVFRTHVAYEDEDAFRFYDFIFADSAEEFDEYIDMIKSLSLYETGVGASYGDLLITLSTCEYTAEDGRFVVVAKKIS